MLTPKSLASHLTGPARSSRALYYPTGRPCPHRPTLFFGRPVETAARRPAMLLIVEI